MGEHSKLLSPSASKRWMACTGSSQKIIDAKLPNTTSEAAERGTLQHHYAEKLFLGAISVKVKPDELSEEEWDHVKIAVVWAQDYLESLEDPDLEVYTEMRITLPHPYDQCFGTADIIAYSPRLRLLIEMDYKFGFVAVAAAGNSQLMIYGLGSAAEFPLWDIDEVHMLILGPKFNNAPDIFEMEATALNEWYEFKLIPAMDGVLGGLGLIIAGDYCETNYCPARGQCSAQESESSLIMDNFLEGDTIDMELVPADEVDNVVMVNGRNFLMSDGEMGSLIDKLPVMKSIVKSIELAALERLKDGRRIVCEDGPLKLVRGKANRVWVDQVAAEKYVKGKIGVESSYTKKFLSPAQAETQMKPHMKDKQQIANNFYKHITKGEGKLSFAHASDKREAIEYTNPLLEDTGGFEDTSDIEL